MHRRVRTARGAWLCAMVLVAGAGLARADDDERRRQAAQAYGEAENAVLAGDFSRAASLFERANGLVPTPQALRMAVQMHLAADQPRLAARRAEELLRRYPYDPSSRSLALEILDQMSARFVRVFVTCDAECAIRVDGQDQAAGPGRSHIVYLSPGRHTLDAIFDDDVSVSERIRRPAGQAVTLAFQRAEARPEPRADARPDVGADAPSEGETGAPPAGTGVARSSSAGTTSAAGHDTAPASMAPRRELAAVERIAPPRVPLIVGSLLTAGLGVATAWSHRDTLALEQRAAGEAASARRRTQLLLGATALSAAVTVAVSVIWARLAGARGQPPRREHLELGMTVDAGGYWVGMAGAF